MFSGFIRIKLDWSMDRTLGCEVKVNATDSILNLSLNAD